MVPNVSKGLQIAKSFTSTNNICLFFSKQRYKFEFVNFFITQIILVVLQGTDILGLAAFLLPNMIIRMTNFVLTFAYMREKAMLPTFLLFLLINISILYRYRKAQSGINLISSALCSLFCVVILPEDPSRKDRKGSSDVNSAVMKRVSLQITSISLPLVFLLSWGSYMLVMYLPGLKSDLDILFTFEQYWFIMSRTFTGLFILSTISCGWFALTYDKQTVELPGLSVVLSLNRWIKMIVDLLIILCTLGLLIGNVAKFPSGPNAVVLTEERGSGVYLRYGYTYQNINTTLQCTHGNLSNWVCGGYELRNGQNHHHLSTEDSFIIYLGDKLKMQDQDMKLMLFSLQSEELETKLTKSVCATCMSQSTQCKKIEQNFQTCETLCTTFPAESRRIKKIKIDKRFEDFVSKQDLQHSPYKIDESLEIQSVCEQLHNPVIKCLGNNKWEIPDCKGKR